MKPMTVWARRSSRQRRSCQDVGVDEAFERIRLPVVDPVLGAVVFDGLAAGAPQGRVVLLLHGFP